MLLEFYDYFVGSFWMMWPPFFVSLPAGMGWVIGANGFAVFSAFAHQLQHENPKKCFWMPRPVHYIHHTHNQWHHNFGMATDFWDRVFGTYKPMEWENHLRVDQCIRQNISGRSIGCGAAMRKRTDGWQKNG